MSALKCTKHPHSSEKSAIKCINKRLGKKADRVIEASGVLKNRSLLRYRKTSFNPPVVINKQGIEIFVFFSAYTNVFEARIY